MRVSPQFNADPVIVIHIGTDDSEQGQWLAACCGEKFEPDSSNDYKHIPRVPCIGCLNVTKRRS